MEAGHVWIKAAASEALLLIHAHALVTIASDVSLFVILLVAGFHLLLLMMMMMMLMFLAFGSFSGDYDVIIIGFILVILLGISTCLRLCVRSIGVDGDVLDTSLLSVSMRHMCGIAK